MSLMELGPISASNIPGILWRSSKPTFALLEDDFFETYAPVGHQTTVCLMLILENLLGLKSKQTDITVTFLHANLGDYEKVYVTMPLGLKQFSSNRNFKVLCLKKTLYVLCQSSCAFWNYFTKKLGNCHCNEKAVKNYTKTYYGLLYKKGTSIVLNMLYRYYFVFDLLYSSHVTIFKWFLCGHVSCCVVQVIERFFNIKFWNSWTSNVNKNFMNFLVFFICNMQCLL